MAELTSLSDAGVAGDTFGNLVIESTGPKGHIWVKREVTQITQDVQDTKIAALETAVADPQNATQAELDAVNTALAAQAATDAGLQTALDNLNAGNATDAEVAVIQAAIQAQIDTLNAEQATQDTAMATEQARATAAETALDTRVSALEALPPAEVDQAELDVEKARIDALEAEQTLQNTALASAIADRVAADALKADQAALDAEIASTDAEQTAQDTRLTDLETATADFETAAQLDARDAAQKAEYDAIQAALTQEITDRTDADALDEKVANKVVAIRPTPTADDTAYPTEKAVRDALDGLSGDFVGLTDTPNDLTGLALQILRVNAAENAVEAIALAATLVAFDNATAVLPGAPATTQAAIEALKALIDQEPQQDFVADLAARDAIADPITGAIVHVSDASADPAITAGWAKYTYNSAAWEKYLSLEDLTSIVALTDAQLQDRANAADTGLVSGKLIFDLWQANKGVVADYPVAAPDYAVAKPQSVENLDQWRATKFQQLPAADATLTLGVTYYGKTPGITFTIPDPGPNDPPWIEIINTNRADSGVVLSLAFASPITLSQSNASITNITASPAFHHVYVWDGANWDLETNRAAYIALDRASNPNPVALTRNAFHNVFNNAADEMVLRMPNNVSQGVTIRYDSLSTGDLRLEQFDPADPTHIVQRDNAVDAFTVIPASLAGSLIHVEGNVRLGYWQVYVQPPTEAEKPMVYQNGEELAVDSLRSYVVPADYAPANPDHERGNPGEEVVLRVPAGTAPDLTTGAQYEAALDIGGTGATVFFVGSIEDFTAVAPQIIGDTDSPVFDSALALEGQVTRYIAASTNTTDRELTLQGNTTFINMTARNPAQVGASPVTLKPGDELDVWYQGTTTYYKGSAAVEFAQHNQTALYIPFDEGLGGFTATNTDILVGGEDRVKGTHVVFSASAGDGALMPNADTVVDLYLKNVSGGATLLNVGTIATDHVSHRILNFTDGTLAPSAAAADSGAANIQVLGSRDLGAEGYWVRLKVTNPGTAPRFRMGTYAVDTTPPFEADMAWYFWGAAELPKETFLSRQYYPAFVPNPEPSINNTTIVTGVDMTNPAMDGFGITVRDDFGAQFSPWPEKDFWFRSSRVNGDRYFIDTHDTGYIEVFVDDYATGTIRFVDAIRNMRLRRITFWAEGANGYVVPTATTSKTPITVTANGGATNIGGAASTTVLEGAGEFGLQIELPLGQAIDTAAFTPPAGTLTTIDALRGVIYLTVAEGTGDVDLTVPFTTVTDGGWITSNISVQGGGSFAEPANATQTIYWRVVDGMLKGYVMIDWRSSTGGNAGSGQYSIDLAQLGVPLDWSNILGESASEHGSTPLGTLSYFDPNVVSAMGQIRRATGDAITFVFRTETALNFADWGSDWGGLGGRALFLGEFSVPTVGLGFGGGVINGGGGGATDLTPYRTSAAQDVIDAAVAARVTTLEGATTGNALPDGPGDILTSSGANTFVWETAPDLAAYVNAQLNA